MKKIIYPMKKASYLLALLLCLSSCKLSTKETTVTIGNRYTLTIPAYMEKTDKLNTEASLQYQHLGRMLYVIVIDEQKETLWRALEDNKLTDEYSNDFDGYARLIFGNLKPMQRIYSEQPIRDTTINGMPARLFVFNAHIENVDVYVQHAITEGKSAYYQVMVWTLSAKESQAKERMDKIVFSLKEL